MISEEFLSKDKFECRLYKYLGKCNEMPLFTNITNLQRNFNKHNYIDTFEIKIFETILSQQTEYTN